MQIIAHDPFASEAKAAAIGVRLVSLDDALGQGDFFSLHTPLTPQTKVGGKILLARSHALAYLALLSMSVDFMMQHNGVMQVVQADPAICSCI